MIFIKLNCRQRHVGLMETRPAKDFYLKLTVIWFQISQLRYHSYRSPSSISMDELFFNGRKNVTT